MVVFVNWNIAAIALSVFLPFTQAKAVTIDRFIQVYGDVLAVASICPNYDVDQKVWDWYMSYNGITERLIKEDDNYAKDVASARENSFKLRKAMTVADNCRNAFSLYGVEGSVLPNLLVLREKQRQ